MAAKTHAQQHTALNLITGWVGLLTASPTDAGTQTAEVTGGGYARQLGTFAAIVDAATSSSRTNSATVTFPIATAAWGTVTYAALFDAATGGNMQYYGPLDNVQTVNTGGQMLFNPGKLTVSEA